MIPSYPRKRELIQKGRRKQKVAKALSNIASGKAAGLDGIPVEVWKALAKMDTREKAKEPDNKSCKDTADIPEILTVVLNDIMANGVEQHTNFAKGWMCPLYKKKDMADISNYRPITVSNTDYKILTKVLTERVLRVSHSLIHPDQAEFIKGCSILDQTKLIRLVMETTKEHKGAIVCLDQEKAYGKVCHGFLWETLNMFGFHPLFVKVIQYLYANAKTAVILNGSVGTKYTVTRGVQQSNPLPCLLFDLAIESLASMLQKSA